MGIRETLAYILYSFWGQSKVYDAVNEGVIDHDTWAYCEPCDCESPFLRKSCLVCGSGIETDLFEDLELLLSKHLGVDWTWEYKGEGHPLMINSEHLPKLWEKMVESEGSDEKL